MAKQDTQDVGEKRLPLYCALSGEIPEVPVVSPASGAIFEKRLIMKYLDNDSIDPINGKPLTKEQLVEIKVEQLIKPKNPSQTSIPAILKCLQDEWDAVV